MNAQAAVIEARVFAARAGESTAKAKATADRLESRSSGKTPSKR